MENQKFRIKFTNRIESTRFEKLMQFGESDKRRSHPSERETPRGSHVRATIATSRATTREIMPLIYSGRYIRRDPGF